MQSLRKKLQVTLLLTAAYVIVQGQQSTVHAGAQLCDEACTPSSGCLDQCYATMMDLENGTATTCGNWGVYDPESSCGGGGCTPNFVRTQYSYGFGEIDWDLRPGSDYWWCTFDEIVHVNMHDINNCPGSHDDDWCTAHIVGQIDYNDYFGQCCDANGGCNDTYCPYEWRWQY